MSTSAEKLDEVRDSGVDFEHDRIFIVGDINDDMAEEILTAMHVYDRDFATARDVYVTMHTPGGDEPSGYAIHDAFALSRHRIIIEGYGNICSIAAAILQSADVRRLAPNCDVMLHNGSRSDFEKQERTDNNVIQRIAREIERDNVRYRSIIERRMKKALFRREAAVEHDAITDLIKKWCDEETYFTADEAVRYGLADEIITTRKKP